MINYSALIAKTLYYELGSMEFILSRAKTGHSFAGTAVSSAHMQLFEDQSIAFR